MIRQSTVDDVLAVLGTVLAELGVEAAAVTPAARLRADLELDSTELVQVALELTRHFGVRVKLAAKDDLTLAQVCRLTVEAAPIEGVPVDGAPSAGEPR